jgi:hypothetical protein
MGIPSSSSKFIKESLRQLRSKTKKGQDVITKNSDHAATKEKSNIYEDYAYKSLSKKS